VEYGFGNSDTIRRRPICATSSLDLGEAIFVVSPKASERCRNSQLCWWKVSLNTHGQGSRFPTGIVDGWPYGVINLNLDGSRILRGFTDLLFGQEQAHTVSPRIGFPTALRFLGILDVLDV